MSEGVQLEARRPGGDLRKLDDPEPDHALLALFVDADTQRPVVRTCAWCAATFPVKPRGRLPQWCSAACRQRAWEQARAAASGRSAVTVVERLVPAPVAAPVPVPRRVKGPGPSVPAAVPTTGSGWVQHLHELARQLAAGRIYDRDLDPVILAFNDALDALTTRIQRRR